MKPGKLETESREIPDSRTQRDGPRLPGYLGRFGGAALLIRRTPDFRYDPVRLASEDF